MRVDCNAGLKVRSPLALTAWFLLVSITVSANDFTVIEKLEDEWKSSTQLHPSQAKEPTFVQSTTDVVVSSTLDGDGFNKTPFSTENGRGRLRILGGEAQGRPCCTSWGPARVDCFIPGPQSNVLHMSIDHGEYSEWEDFQGTIVGEIECLSRAVGIIDVLVLGTDISLYVKTYSEGQWSDWVSKGGKLMDVPSCVVRTPAVINCMLRGTDNAGYHIGATSGKWGSYASMGGTLWNPIECCSRSESTLNCFGSGTNLRLYVKGWSNPGGWADWKDLGGLVKGRPSVTTWEENRIDIFTLGVKNNVMQRTFDRAWKDWADLGGVFDSAPECVTTGVGRIHCFAIGANSYLYKNDFRRERWTGWISTNIAFIETPSCVVSRKHEVSCYVRGFNKQVFEIVFQDEYID